jgi:hypothetical protein
VARGRFAAAAARNAPLGHRSGRCKWTLNGALRLLADGPTDRTKLVVVVVVVCGRAARAPVRPSERTISVAAAAAAAAATEHTSHSKVTLNQPERVLCAAGNYLRPEVVEGQQDELGALGAASTQFVTSDKEPPRCVSSNYSPLSILRRPCRARAPSTHRHTDTPTHRHTDTHLHTNTHRRTHINPSSHMRGLSRSYGTTTNTATQCSERAQISAPAAEVCERRFLRRSHFAGPSRQRSFWRPWTPPPQSSNNFRTLDKRHVRGPARARARCRLLTWKVAI